MNYLHTIRIIHRDLKSANILVTQNFVVKISDFGESRLIDNEMTIVGSQFWIAPEIIMGEGYNEKADVFSFGIVLAEMELHDKPYSGYNHHHIYIHLLNPILFVTLTVTLILTLNT